LPFSTRTARILRLALSTTTWAIEGALHVGCSPGRGPPIAHASAVLLGAGGLQLGEGISLKKKLMEAASHFGMRFGHPPIQVLLPENSSVP